MPTLARLSYWEGMILLGGLLALVLWRLVGGGISLRGLLDGDFWDGSGYSTEFSPGRAQLLMFTILSALYYMLQVIHNPSALPRVPPALVAAQAGSQAAYLLGKAYSLLFKNSKSPERRTP